MRPAVALSTVRRVVQERIDILRRVEDGRGRAAGSQSVAELVSLVNAAMEGPADRDAVWRRADCAGPVP